jgi:hypothetical protein
MVLFRAESEQFVAKKIQRFKIKDEESNSKDSKKM